ncbi:hypothetical protein GF386_00230 [Candidatus Pacearchaeota archaeon]|nr:hypothetical protein [Candidatus Pacearchaeota archaeon]MBD3282709.1 hypothetical protein [Candidatus Pacearchaeota archaeon]
MKNKIKARFIFEILGRPPEHIKETLEKVVDTLGKQEGVKILEKKVHEPKLLEKENVENMFTTFSEVEVEVDNLNLVFLIVLNMLPSNVEITEPSELKTTNFDLTAILSDLAIKIHKYDEIAKALTLQRNQLINKINQMTDKSDKEKNSE